jgi:hypothetical protein
VEERNGGEGREGKEGGRERERDETLGEGDNIIILTVASLSNLSAVIKSVGRCILIPFFSAFSISSPTMVDPSSSNREDPI